MRRVRLETCVLDQRKGSTEFYFVAKARRPLPKGSSCKLSSVREEGCDIIILPLMTETANGSIVGSCEGNHFPFCYALERKNGIS